MRGTHRGNYACVLFFSAVLFSATSLAAVTTTTNPGDLNTGNLIDFESMATGPLVGGSVSFGNLTITADELGITSISSFAYSGTIVEGNTLQPVASDSLPGPFSQYVPMTFVFSQLVSEFGLGLFDINWDGDTLTAFDQFDTQIASVTITDVGPGNGVHATFMGFLSDSANISKVVFSPDNPFEVYSVDNIVFSAVPLSGADILFSIGLVSLTIASRRRIGQEDWC